MIWDGGAKKGWGGGAGKVDVVRKEQWLAGR